MAILKSDIVTLQDAGTTVAGHLDGTVKAKVAKYAAAALSDNDVILMFKISVDADILSLVFNCDDLGTTGTLNCGFYKGDGSAIVSDASAVDEDALATAIDVNAAAVSNTEIRFEVQDINTIGKKAWELAGLSARPAYGDFYIAFTAAAATTAAGDITLRVLYI